MFWMDTWNSRWQCLACIAYYLGSCVKSPDTHWFLKDFVKFLIRKRIRCFLKYSSSHYESFKKRKKKEVLKQSKSRRFRTSEMSLNSLGVSEILFRNSKSLMSHISLWLSYRHYVIVSPCFTKHQLTSLPEKQDSEAVNRKCCNVEKAERSSLAQEFGDPSCLWLCDLTPSFNIPLFP